MSSKLKLYYTPTSCGAASYIAAHAAGIQFDSEEVNIGTHKTASGADYYKINPKGNVPAVITKEGVLLNEGAATLQYIADQNPASNLAPAFGTVQRYELINALNYIASEVHSSFGPLFNPKITPEAKEAQVTKLNTKLDYLENHMIGQKKFLVGNNFTVADSYLYIVLGWTAYVGVSLDKHPNVQKWHAGIKALPVVQEAHAKMAAATHAK